MEETKDMKTAIAVKADEQMLAPPRISGKAAEIAMTRNGVMLQSLDELMRFSRMCVAGGAAPKGMSEGQAAVAIQAGLERGLGPLGGLTQAVVINGVLSWRGQAAVALIQNSGACVAGSLKFGIEGEGDARKAVCTSRRKGYTADFVTEFTVDDARRMGLWGKSGPWNAVPNRMLQWRAIGNHARDHYPDVLGGFPLAEEAQDFEVAPAAKPSPPDKPPTLDARGPSADPLFDAIDGKRVEPDLEDAPEVTAPPTEAERAAEAEPESGDDPPYASHEEADRAIAESEGQGGLFGGEA